MRSKNLPPEEAPIYQAVSAEIDVIMAAKSLSTRKQLEYLSMKCADVAKVEGPDCLDFVERVIQGWIEDQQDKSSD